MASGILSDACARSNLVALDPSAFVVWHDIWGFVVGALIEVRSFRVSPFDALQVDIETQYKKTRTE